MIGWWVIYWFAVVVATEGETMCWIVLKQKYTWFKNMIWHATSTTLLRDSLSRGISTYFILFLFFGSSRLAPAQPPKTCLTLLDDRKDFFSLQKRRWYVKKASRHCCSWFALLAATTTRYSAIRATATIAKTRPRIYRQPVFQLVPEMQNFEGSCRQMFWSTRLFLA